MGWQDLGARIAALRRAKGWSQAQLAERAGLSRVYIAKVESGEEIRAARPRTPSLPVLERIAQALGARLVVDLVERRPRQKGGRDGR